MNVQRFITHFFLPLNLLFDDVLVAVVVLVSLSSLNATSATATPRTMSIEKLLIFFIEIIRLYLSINSAGASLFKISSASHVKAALISNERRLYVKRNIDIAP